MRLRQSLPSALLLFILFTCFIHRNLFFDNFNLDEVILYFSAQGIAYDEFIKPQLGTIPIKDFWSILSTHTHGSSIGPGGFKLILYFWSSLLPLMEGHTVLLFRLLPYTFFFFSFLIYFSFLKSFRIAPLLGSFLLYLVWQDQIFFNHLFTLSPQIMEVCGVLSLCALIFHILLGPAPQRSIRYYLLAGAPLAILSTSRYTLWPLILTAFLFLIWFYRKEEYSKRPLCAFIPSFIVMALFSLLSLRTQLQYSSPSLEQYFLGGLGFWSLVKQILSPLVVSFLSYPIYHFFLNSNATKKERNYSLFLLLFFLVTLLLDLFNLSPFILDQKYALFFHAIALLNICLLLGPILERGLSRWSFQSLLVIFTPIFLSFSFYSFQKVYFRQASDLIPITSHLTTIISPHDHFFCDQKTWGMVYFHRNIIKSFKVPQCRPLNLLLDSSSPQDQRSFILKRTDTDHIKGKVILGGAYEQLLLIKN